MEMPVPDRVELTRAVRRRILLLGPLLCEPDPRSCFSRSTQNAAQTPSDSTDSTGLTLHVRDKAACISSVLPLIITNPSLVSATSRGAAGAQALVRVRKST